MKYQNFCHSLGLAIVSWSLLLLSAQSADLLENVADASLTEASPPQSIDPAADLMTEPISGESELEDSVVPEPVTPLNLTPETIEQSPVLQRWLESVPDVQSDIRNDPSFTTRIQAGYTFFPSSKGTGGIVVGVDDLFVGDTSLTVSADYQQNFPADGAASSQFRLAYGADLHYYVLPLGSYFNVSPIVGYRYAESGDDYRVEGAHLGVRARFIPSRTGAADITLDQSWIVGDSESLTITQLNFGYAITQELRLGTDLEWQSTQDAGDSRVGVNLEWSL